MTNALRTLPGWAIVFGLAVKVAVFVLGLILEEVPALAGVVDTT